MVIVFNVICILKKFQPYCQTFKLGISIPKIKGRIEMTFKTSWIHIQTRLKAFCIMQLKKTTIIMLIPLDKTLCMYNMYIVYTYFTSNTLHRHRSPTMGNHWIFPQSNFIVAYHRRQITAISLSVITLSTTTQL